MKQSLGLETVTRVIQVMDGPCYAWHNPSHVTESCLTDEHV